MPAVLFPLRKEWSFHENMDRFAHGICLLDTLNGTTMQHMMANGWRQSLEVITRSYEPLVIPRSRLTETDSFLLKKGRSHKIRTPEVESTEMKAISKMNLSNCQIAEPMG